MKIGGMSGQRGGKTEFLQEPLFIRRLMARMLDVLEMTSLRDDFLVCVLAPHREAGRLVIGSWFFNWQQSDGLRSLKG